MAFVIRSLTGFYYCRIGGFGHWVFCDEASQAARFDRREEADELRRAIDATPDGSSPNTSGLSIEAI